MQHILEYVKKFRTKKKKKYRVESLPYTQSKNRNPKFEMLIVSEYNKLKYKEK